jgi:hypothetical protein
VIAPAVAAALALAAGVEAFEVVPAGPGRQRLDVAPALVSASARGDLADLRLHDRSGREVPYLLVAPPEGAPRWVPPARIRPIPAVRRKESGAELDLGAAREVAAVRLEVPAAASFLRALRVEGSVDRARWMTLAAAGAIYALREGDPCPATPCPRAENDVVRFEPATVRYLRVVFDDRRAPPLPPLRGAAALLAEDAPPPDGPAVPLAVSRREGEPGVSRFALVLPGPNLPVRAIHLEVDARHLFRRARVLEARLQDGRLVPRALGEGQLVRTERDGVTVSALRVEIARPEERELELVVEDGDGDPLALRGAAAELAPLPWAFFESADGAPLVATAGDPERAAPRYDLEALRPELAGPGAALPRARLAGALRAPEAPGAAPATADAALPGAPLDVSAFRVVRTLVTAAPGLAAVRLDAAVLAESPDLADVRIAAPDGRQLPYLAESRPEPLAVPLAPSPPLAGTAAGRPGATVRALPLAHGAAPPSRLVLGTSARVFARSVRVYAERAGDPGAARLPIAEAVWEHADPSRPAPPLAIPLPAVRGERLLLAVDDGDNAPLPIASARLLLPAWRLRFFHPGPELRLLYGAERLAAPRYDLALLAPRLRAAPATEVALGPAPPPQRRVPTARAAFWAVLAAAVGGLLLVLARLVRPAPPAA